MLAVRRCGGRRGGTKPVPPSWPRRITQEDVDKVIGYAGVVRLPEDSSLLGIVPRDIIVDGQGGIDRPIGMGAVRLEVDAIVLTAGTSQLEACEAAIRPLRTELAGKYANAICSAEAVLTQEELEHALADGEDYELLFTVRPGSCCT